MNRRRFLWQTGVGAATLALGGCSGGLAQKKRRSHTNFVIIFTDDQGYGDVGAYGARDFETPNLDRMANEGVRFTDFYVSQAVCSASRAALLTGCYCNRVGIQGALMPWDTQGIHGDEETIAEVLKKKGYATGIFGKWHLGHQRKFLPLQHGFDEYLGLPYSNDMWPVDYDGTHVDQEDPGPLRWRLRYPFLPLIEGNETIARLKTQADQDALTSRYTERAVGFIDRHAEEPFFLYVPHSMPHVPLGVSDKFRGKSEQGMYGDVMMEIDWSVGEILRALKKNGLEENTLVVFTSDNGPWLNFGNHAGSAAPLREGKGTMWEGGARVPCIMRWPGTIGPGRVCTQMAATIDLLPTLAAIAQAPLPEKKIDGVNILGLLRGEPGANPREHYFFYYRAELQAVRQGKWKLHFPHGYLSYEGVEPGKDGWPGPRIGRQTGLELYDLENDIGEKRNVAGRYPEVVERLQRLGKKARAELGDSLTNQKGAGVRPPGTLGIDIEG